MARPIIFDSAATPSALPRDLESICICVNGDIYEPKWSATQFSSAFAWSLVGRMPVTGVPAGIPAVDPHVIGLVWANAGVLTVSAG